MGLRSVPLLRVLRYRLDSWTRNLFTDFPWLIDGLCIRAEILARRGEHEEAMRLFRLLRERGLPMFPFGFRFAIDRLSGYRTAADTGRLLDRSWRPWLISNGRY